MIRPILLLSAAIGTVFALSAPAAAQFRTDLSPSAFRASLAPPKQQEPVSGRMNALSPLGGKQGTPVNKPVGEAAKPMTAYAGAADPSLTDPNARPGIGASAGKPDDPTVEDPNKPRQPLKPNSLKKGVAPRS